MSSRLLKRNGQKSGKMAGMRARSWCRPGTVTSILTEPTTAPHEHYTMFSKVLLTKVKTVASLASKSASVTGFRNQSTAAKKWDEMPTVYPTAQLTDYASYLKFINDATNETDAVRVPGFGGILAVVVSHPDLIQYVYQQKSFRNRPNTEGMFIPLYNRITGNKTSLGFSSRNGPDWEKHRSVGNKAILHPKVVSASAGYINNFADKKLVSPIKQAFGNSNKARIDASAITAYFTLATILKVGLNMEKDEKKLEDIGHTVSAIMKTPMAAIYDPTSPLKAEFEKNADKLGAILREIMKQKQEELAKNPDNVSDVLSTLLQMTSETDALSDLMDIVVGGTDTTATTLNAAFYLLGTHPEVQEKLYKEVSSELDLSQPISFEALEKTKYLKAVAKEVLRLFPAAPLNARANETPEVIAGYEIPENTATVITNAKVHRDPRFYEKPDSFNPDRWIDQKHHPFAWAPFGHGVRSCLGQRLALAETHIALAKLVNNFKIKYVDDKPPAFEWSGVTMAVRNPINVEVEMRN